MSNVSGLNLLNSGITTIHTRVIGGSVVFAKEYIWLNGHKVKIGGSLSDTSRALNRHYLRTGVNAVVVNAGTSNERLKLITRSNNFTINDPKGVLSSLYRAKKIGTSDDMLIQIAATNKRKVNFLYRTSVPEKSLTQEHMQMSESATKALVTKRLPQNSLPAPGNVIVREEGEDIVHEHPRVYQEHLRRAREIAKQAIDKSYKENSAQYAEDAVNDIIRCKNLKNTTPGQRELTKNTIGKELYESGLGEDFLRQNYDMVLKRIVNQIDKARDSSLFRKRLVISELNIKRATQTVLQQIKFEQYEAIAQNIIKDLGLTIAKSDYLKISGTIRDGLLEGRELPFSEIYGSPVVKKRMSGILLYCASKDELSRGKLSITPSRLVVVKDGALNLRGLDLVV